MNKAQVSISSALWDKLADEDRESIEYFSETFRFSTQQLKKTADWFIDCRMWQETKFWLDIQEALAEVEENKKLNSKQLRDLLFQKIEISYSEIVSAPREYKEIVKEFQPKYKYGEKTLQGNIFRLCPAASERAVCCNLKVLNVVDNCAMGCSYCVLQNHYDEATINIPVNLKEKLDDLKLNPDRRYRIGTGEYSDSLFWGNKNGILDHLFSFAKSHNNILLELKTKSANIAYLLENDVPINVVASWSLNPQIIVEHEEQGTASLERRLAAARKVADKGVKVAFHIHPMMYYKGFEEGYQDLIAKVKSMFTPDEVMWISLGCVTLMKGFAEKMRRDYKGSKLLQMPTEITQDGKITYEFSVRKRLYDNAITAIGDWQKEVFLYLCMEHAPMWDDVMPYTYKNMGEFDDAFSDSAFAKVL